MLRHLLKKLANKNQYYLSHFSRESPIWMLSCFQNKTEEEMVEVRPCIMQMYIKPTALRNRVILSIIPNRKVLLSQLLKKLANKNQYYLSHLGRGSPIWKSSCFQNKTEEKVAVRPCII